MACLVDPTCAGGAKVTFLYKLVAGASDKSYGLNVARLARLPDAVIECARLRSAHFEKRLRPLPPPPAPAAVGRKWARNGG